MPVGARARKVNRMGFLDKLFGRTKDTAGDVADNAAPVVDKAQDAGGEAWNKASDVASDTVDKAKDAVGGASDEVQEKAEDATGGDDRPPGPTAA